jgi:hypothetical protein
MLQQKWKLQEYDTIYKEGYVSICWLYISACAQKFWLDASGIPFGKFRRLKNHPKICKFKHSTPKKLWKPAKELFGYYSGTICPSILKLSCFP